MDACRAMNVSKSAMRDWINKLKQERCGITPQVGKALTPEQQQIQALEAKIRKIEREKDILKKATALLMSDALNTSR